MTFVPGLNSSAYGTEDAYVTIKMEEYDSIVLTKSFKVTKLAYTELVIPN